MTPAEEERAAVVAWLREQSFWKQASPAHVRAMKPSDWADLIERGQHLRDPQA